MKKSSTKVNIIYQVIYDILLMILPFLTSPYVARVLGANGLGIYSYYYSIATYFVLFSQLGIKNYGNRIIAKHRDNQEEVNELFSNLTTIHIIHGISVFFLEWLSHFKKSVRQKEPYKKVGWQIFSLFNPVVFCIFFYYALQAKFNLSSLRIYG